MLFAMTPRSLQLTLTLAAVGSLAFASVSARAADKPAPAPKQASLAVDPTGAPQFGTQVEAIKLTGLEEFAGKFVHAFYVSAREAAVDIVGSELKVRAVLLSPIRMEVPASGELQLPAVRVPRKNFMAFNYLLLAVTGAEPVQLYLKNADSSPIEDARVKNAQELEKRPESDFQTEKKLFISSFSLAKFKNTVSRKNLGGDLR